MTSTGRKSRDEKAIQHRAPDTGPAWHGEAIAELLDHDMETMVRDIVEHDAYLGGQIAMLKKVIRAARAPASTSGATKL